MRGLLEKETNIREGDDRKPLWEKEIYEAKAQEKPERQAQLSFQMGHTVLNHPQSFNDYHIAALVDNL